jgi:hypothetical protein
MYVSHSACEVFWSSAKLSASPCITVPRTVAVEAMKSFSFRMWSLYHVTGFSKNFPMPEGEILNLAPLILKLLYSKLMLYPFYLMFPLNQRPLIFSLRYSSDSSTE